MATQEVAATSTTKPPTKDSKDDIHPDDFDTTIPKSSHNNAEAAKFLKRVNTITDTFADNLSGFNRHALEDNYMNFIHDLH